MINKKILTYLGILLLLFIILLTSCGTTQGVEYQTYSGVVTSVQYISGVWGGIDDTIIYFQNGERVRINGEVKLEILQNYTLLVQFFLSKEMGGKLIQIKRN